ncbi:hypothetical protein Bhyg_16536, partial [Pseudolycoriella hygida]
MNCLKTLLFLGCIAFATCDKDGDEDDACKWSRCEGIWTDGYKVCKDYGYTYYANSDDVSDCPFYTLKRYCCNLYPL